jgi:hypothetical protein
LRTIMCGAEPRRGRSRRDWIPDVGQYPLAIHANAQSIYHGRPCSLVLGGPEVGVRSLKLPVAALFAEGVGKPFRRAPARLMNGWLEVTDAD